MESPMGPQAARAPTPTYPAEDDVGETLLHLLLRTFLFALVRRWLAERGHHALVGSEQFIYWVEGDPHRCVAPDLYVLFGVDPMSTPRSWKVWEHGVAPRFALEIVSDNVDKDYVSGPLRYAELGVDELVVYDPEWAIARDRVRWQVYRRVDGQLRLVTRTDGDRVSSAVLGCHLRVVPADGVDYVRIGCGPEGDELVPTDAERRDALAVELAELRRRLQGSRE